MKTLREAREQKGMTGRAVAAAIGIAQSHLSEIEQGKRLPSPDEEDKLAEFSSVRTSITGLHLTPHAQAILMTGQLLNARCYLLHIPFYLWSPLRRLLLLKLLRQRATVILPI